jgi:hypothetical protein
MRPFIISQDVRQKIQQKVPPVTEKEILECYENKCGTYLIDDREKNRTNPETLWFIAETNHGRCLKVALMFIDGNVHIKSAYDPNEKEIEIYERRGK